MLDANNPKLKSFIEIKNNSHFPIQNLPFGVFQKNNVNAPHVGVAIGEFVLDLTEIENEGLLKILHHDDHHKIFSNSTLNAFLELGQIVWRDVRTQISELLRHDNPTLRDNESLRKRVLIPQNDVRMLMPITVRNFSDFFSSEYHLNLASELNNNYNKPPIPNWHHIPLAYHCRTSSIAISGVPCQRPSGQFINQDSKGLVFGPTKVTDKEIIFAPTRALDFELELGFIVGTGNLLGEAIAIESARKHIFGVVLLNDWSARDIQAWEAVPLGSFLGKSFFTSISPWIVTLDALEPFQTTLKTQNPTPLLYLREEPTLGYDINLQASLLTKKMKVPEVICKTNSKYIYWSIAQQLVHQTSNGCNTESGDLLGTGAISGPTSDARASFLELSMNGTKPYTLNNGEQRIYLEDGDEVIMTGYSEHNDYRVGFGELRNKIVA